MIWTPGLSFTARPRPSKKARGRIQQKRKTRKNR